MLIDRRTFLVATGVLAVAPKVSAAQLADTYYEVLLRHTRWAETQWDATAGRYRPRTSASRSCSATPCC